MSELQLKTVNDVLVHVTGRGSETVLLRPDSAGAWQPITSDELYGMVRALAGALEKWGIGKGDRVAILSENRWEWVVSDFAVLALGAVDVPLYATNHAQQVGYMLRDSGAKVAIVSSREQRDKLAAEAAGMLPELEQVIVMNPGEEGTDTCFAEIMKGAKERQSRDAAFDAMVAFAKPSDLLTIIYTSGTTGEPKGVALTHGNLATNINFSAERMGTKAGDRMLEFLPLSHVYARNVDYALMVQSAVIAHCAQIDQLAAMMKSFKPTIFVGVPRLFEKVRQGVEGKSATSPVKKKILAWAVATGRKHREQTLRGDKPSGLAWKLADKLVFSKIREAFGGSVGTFFSGSAALGMDTAGWFADIGIRIFEGYGLTETSPVISFNHAGAHKIGTIGTALDNVEVRLAPDGEIEVKGPSIFKEYWKKPKETAEVFTPDGWFKTGDIGTLDAAGFLSITDRKKEILKTSGGKMIAPQPIENRLKSQVLVGNAAVVGDKHKYVSVLISPNLPALKGWAKANGIFATEPSALVADARVKAEYERIVADVNKGLAHYETLKRVTVVPDEWAIDSGELTPSMKLKRRIVEKKYEREIAEFYQDENAVAGNRV